MKKQLVAVLTAMLAVNLLGVGGSEAVSGGTAVPDSGYQFLARPTSEAKGCSGALIDPEWVVTASSCLPTTSETKIVVGNMNPVHATTSTAVTRDLALVRLATPAPVEPIALSTTAAAQGETLKIAGFGRTERDWVPDRPRLASFTATAPTSSDVALNGAQDLCMGDAGGPLLRHTAAGPELVGIGRTCLDISSNNADTPITIEVCGAAPAHLSQQWTVRV